MSLRFLARSALCVAVVTLAASSIPACAGASSAPPGKPTVADFTLETVEGKTASLSDYTGKNVVMIDFWATWCEPCLSAMPHLTEIYNRHKDQGFVILSIAMDGPDTVAEVRSYVQRQALPFPVLLDQESRAVSLYNPRRSAPFSVILGRDGSVISKHDGFQAGDQVQIEKDVVEALAK